jgi:hypothetical protein
MNIFVIIHLQTFFVAGCTARGFHRAIARYVLTRRICGITAVTEQTFSRIGETKLSPMVRVKISACVALRAVLPSGCYAFICSYIFQFSSYE